MAHYKVILAYDGTGYAGFQRQAKAKTVQGTVESALRRIGWTGDSILAAGRTDSGVHASGQVIAFNMDWVHSDSALQSAMNAHLPRDISAQQVCRVKKEFHPRNDALSRHYRYHLICHPHRLPLEERYTWRIWPGVEIGDLQDAALCLVGTHDFGGFGSPPHPGKSTVRTVTEASWSDHEKRIILDIYANAFLYHMVRRLVFVMVALARKKLGTDEVLRSLKTGSELTATGIAPPNGLILVEVLYDATS